VTDPSGGYDTWSGLRGARIWAAVERGVQPVKKAMSLIVVAGVGIGALFVSTSAAATKPASVKVNLTEFSIVPDKASVKAGRVVFRVKNIGVETHEMVVVAATSPEALPLKPDGSVDEAAIPQAHKYGETGELKVGKSKTLVIKKKMGPGSYVLFCNLVEKMPNGTTMVHFKSGMHTLFTVT
jgi:uncharacterized cupredoxin-like copper-binding protein